MSDLSDVAGQFCSASFAVCEGLVRAVKIMVAAFVMAVLIAIAAVIWAIASTHTASAAPVVKQSASYMCPNCLGWGFTNHLYDEHCCFQDEDGNWVGEELHCSLCHGHGRVTSKARRFYVDGWPMPTAFDRYYENESPAE